MIIVFSTDPKLRGQVASLIRSLGWAVIPVEAWSNVEMDIRARAQCVCFASRMLTSVAIDVFRSIQLETAFMPTLLITSWVPENCIHLKDISPGRVVWAENLVDDLRGVLPAYLLEVSLAERFALLVSRNPRLDDGSIRRAIVDICRCRGPVPSTENFARMACRSRSRLATKLRDVYPGPNRIVSRMLAAVELLKAYDLATRGFSQKKIAKALAVNVKTLQRSAVRLTGVSFGVLSGQTPQVVLKQAMLFRGDGHPRGRPHAGLERHERA